MSHPRPVPASTSLRNPVLSVTFFSLSLPGFRLFKIHLEISSPYQSEYHRSQPISGREHIRVTARKVWSEGAAGRIGYELQLY